MADSEQQRILIIEDEDHIAEGLKLNLSLNDYQVRIAKDGISGLKEWKQWVPDLIVLDIMLPCLDGLSVLQNIRLEDERIPVIILSAKGESDDRIKGFSCGVDDYLAKPFNLEEFMLRVKRLLNRATWAQKENHQQTGILSSVPQIFRFANNCIDFGKLTAHGEIGEINLTEQEARLLKIFVLHKGKPLSRGRLLEIGWGYTKDTTTRTVDNFIVRFRKYFEKDPKKPVFFKSIRSIGYLFDYPDDTN